MSSFSAILSSLQDGKTQEATTASKVATTNQPVGTSQRAAAPLSQKRKLENDETGTKKAIKLDPAHPEARKVIGKAISNTVNQAKGLPATTTTTSGCSKGSTIKPAQLNGGMKSKASTTASTTAKAQLLSISTPPKQPIGSMTAKPRAQGGFASLLAKANAAQERAKAAGPDTIKHKPTAGLKKKDRERLKQVAKIQKQMSRLGRGTANNSGSEGAVAKDASEVVRKPKVDLSQVGTMRAKPVASTAPRPKQKGLGQDKYGGYASWSDLSGAEDEEENYESGSDMEEAGFDDMMEEEQRTARIARDEDQRELEDEERRRKEKAARKKKLMALNDTAAAMKKRY